MLSKISRWFFGLDNSQKQRELVKEIPLEKGKVETIRVPNLGYGNEYKLTKWHVRPGQMVKAGEVVCELETKEILMEFESLYSGRIQATCQIHQNLKVGDEILRIQGI